MEFVAVCKNEVRVYTSSKGWETPAVTIASSAMNPDGFEWAFDGVLCGCINPEGGVTVYNAELDYAPVFEAPKQGSGVRGFYFSPCGSFLVTQERYLPKENKDNIFVYSLNAREGAPMMSFILKSVSDKTWPSLIWTRDERFVLHMVSNEIMVMHGRTPSFQSTLYKIRVPDVAQISLAPNDRFIAAFIPEKNGAPASVRIFDLTSRNSLAQKSFFKAQNISFDWSKSGNGLLFTTTCEGDDKSVSYYGSSALYFLRLDDNGAVSAEGLLSESGTVHDKCWSPVSDEFLALTGSLPAELALFDGRTGGRKVSFGKTRRNTLKWNPFGRLFFSAGFGNLPGDTDIWDKNKALCLASTKLTCAVVSEWAPDGRTILTATTTPRMRVDNKVVIVNYDGKQIAQIAIPELYFACWRPAGRFEDTPPSPRVVQSAKKPEDSPQTVGAYRPKIGGAFAEQMRREKEEENSRQAKKVSPNAGLLVESSVVVGMKEANIKIPLKSRNERKKEAKAKAAFAEEEGEWQQAKNGIKISVSVPTSSAKAEEEPSDREEDPVKQLRNLKKKLKDIEKLAEKDCLNESQKLKLASRAYVEAEIKTLEREIANKP